MALKFINAYFCSALSGKKIDMLLESLEVLDITSEGKAVARHEGQVVFIDSAVPGDIADVQVYRKKKNFMEGRVIRLVKPSTRRTEPQCRHFGTCGGCKWQHMKYENQLEFKEKQVMDAITRIGHLEVRNTRPIAGNDSAYFYRNKLEFTFSNKRWLKKEEMNTPPSNMNALGFHVPGMFDKVLDVTECLLQEGNNEIRNEVKRYAFDKGLSFFDIRQQTGFLRTLMIRTTSTGEMMVLVAVYEWDEEVLFDLLKHLEKTFPQITTIVYAHNPKKNDTLEGLEIKTYKGSGYITENMEGLLFRISPRSFYQTNSKQAYRLYSITRELCGLKGNETVYDLYTGTGTIANFIARHCSKVVGVEYVEDAVRDARKNSEINKIGNTSFFAGDMKDVLNGEFIASHGKPDVIITDPPRAGMHEDVVKAILAAAPDRIVYVSCNPSTQARDMEWLSPAYELMEMQSVDMFPQTSHVENVALLVRRKS